MMNENLRCETPDLRGDEREMIVLHPDLRRGLRSERLLVDRFRETRIDLGELKVLEAQESDSETKPKEQPTRH